MLTRPRTRERVGHDSMLTTVTATLAAIIAAVAVQTSAAPAAQGTAPATDAPEARTAQAGVPSTGSAVAAASVPVRSSVTGGQPRSGRSPAVASATRDGGAEHAFTVRNCDEQYAVFTIPASQAEPYLPEGFVPVGIDGGQLPEGRATFIAVILMCEGPAEDEISAQLWGELIVAPPDAYRHDEALLHYVNVVGMTTSPTIASAYHAWNVPRFCLGRIELQVEIQPTVSTWQSELATRQPDCATPPADEPDGFELSTTVTGQHPPVSGGTVRMFGVEDRQVTSIVDITGNAWNGAMGGVAALDDHGLIPFDLDGPGVPGHAWDFHEYVRPAPLPSQRDDAPGSTSPVDLSSLRAANGHEALSFIADRTRRLAR